VQRQRQVALANHSKSAESLLFSARPFERRGHQFTQPLHKPFQLWAIIIHDATHARVERIIWSILACRSEAVDEVEAAFVGGEEEGEEEEESSRRMKIKDHPNLL